MSVHKVLESQSWITVAVMIGTIGVTGALTFLWVLERLVENQVNQWVYDRPFFTKRILKRPPFRNYFGKYSILKRYKMQCLERIQKVLNWHEERLIKSGMASKKVANRAKQWCFSIFGISIYLFLRDFGHPERALLFCMTLSVYFWWMTGSKIKERKNTFVTGVYKIYRHMALQISSGMSSAEAIKYLHESVEEPFLKEAMYRFSSSYFKTMDLDLALKELTERIEGDEVQVLATVLRQGLQTGDSYEMIIKQEQLMVKRYYAALSAASERIRTKSVLIAIGLCILIFILLAAPMVYEMGRATQSIFLGQ